MRGGTTHKLPLLLLLPSTTPPTTNWCVIFHLCVSLLLVFIRVCFFLLLLLLLLLCCNSFAYVMCCLFGDTTRAFGFFFFNVCVCCSCSITRYRSVIPLRWPPFILDTDCCWLYNCQVLWALCRSFSFWWPSRVLVHALGYTMTTAMVGWLLSRPLTPPISVSLHFSFHSSHPRSANCLPCFPHLCHRHRLWM